MPAKVTNAEKIINDIAIGILENGTKWMWTRAVELAPKGGGGNPYAIKRKSPSGETSTSAIGEIANRLDYEIDYVNMIGTVGLPMGSSLEDIGWWNEYGCFFNENDTILTSEGRKKFKDIKEGELVYTHKGNWKKILKKHIIPIDFIPDQIKITSETGKNITVTPHHPILVKRNNKKIWVEARYIKEGDIIFEVYYNSMSIKKNRRKLSESHYGKKLSEEHKKLLSKNNWMKLENWKPEYTESLKNKAQKTSIAHQGNKYCLGKRWKYTGEKYKKSKERAIKNLEYTKTTEAKKKQIESLKRTYRKYPELHPNRIMAKKGFISFPQKQLFKRVKKVFSHKYKVELEYPIETKNSLRFADVAVPELKLDFEYDSLYWHQDKNKDNLRDKALAELGWKTFRIKGE